MLIGNKIIIKKHDCTHRPKFQLNLVLKVLKVEIYALMK